MFTLVHEYNFFIVVDAELKTKAEYVYVPILLN